jgi:2-haloacid dehalogenase
VFADTRPALTTLRQAGWNLALLTNCDRDLVGQTMRRLGVTIDLVVTAEDAGSYKPALNHFHRFRAASGVADGNWVHVAQSYHHDIRPAHSLGIPRIWINRLGEPDADLLATRVLPDLTGLAPAVEAVRAGAAR